MLVHEISSSKWGFSLNVSERSRWYRILSYSCRVLHPFGLWGRYGWAYRLHSLLANIEFKGEKHIVSIPMTDEQALAYLPEWAKYQLELDND